MPGQQNGFGRRHLRRLILIALLATAPAMAAERSFSVTSFDRIRVEGPFAVTVTTGKSVSAKASGSSEALERVQLRVEGRTLLIRPNMSGWGGYPGRQAAPARITVTTPELNSAILLGSGSLDVDRMRGLKATLSAEGSGRLTVSAMDVDNLTMAVSGSGSIAATGKTRQAAAFVRGAAEIRAPGLIVSDLTLTSETAGAVTMRAMRSARVSAIGLGPVEVQGTAACEIKKQGAGPLVCGK